MKSLPQKYFTCLFIAAMIPAILFTGCGNNSPAIRKEIVCDLPAKTFYGTIVKFSRSDKGDLLSVDTVEYFTGSKARTEFLADKKLKKISDTEVPTLYYIRNSTKDTLSLLLSENSAVVLQTLSFDSTGNFKFNEKSDPADFISKLKFLDCALLKSKLFFFTILNAKIISIKEIYIP
jgi:hypothetical protein